MKYIRIYTDYGFAGTEESRIVKVPDDTDLSTVWEDEWDRMCEQLSCTVDEVDQEQLEEWEIEDSEDWT